MLLPTDTWSAACCWLSSCTSCSMRLAGSRPGAAPSSVSGSASAALWPCSRRANSATKALLSGGSERAMSATTRIRLFGSRLGDLRACGRPSRRRGRARARLGRHAHRDAAQVLDQRQPQHDRDRPQLAELQRLHRLVGGDEAAQACRGSRRPSPCAIGFAARGRRRAAVRRSAPLRQPRQLAAVARRQVALRGADLLLDQVEVVEQPFGRRRDAGAGASVPCAAARRRRRARARWRPGGPAGGRRRAARASSCAGGQRLAVPLHLVGAEQLGAQRLVAIGRVDRGPGRWVGGPGALRPEPGMVPPLHRAPIGRAMRRPISSGARRSRLRYGGRGSTRYRDGRCRGRLLGLLGFLVPALLSLGYCFLLGCSSPAPQPARAQPFQARIHALWAAWRARSVRQRTNRSRRRTASGALMAA